MEKILKEQEEKLRGLSIEYDEELYPHLISTIAERRYVFCIFRNVALLYVLICLFDSNASFFCVCR